MIVLSDRATNRPALVLGEVLDSVQADASQDAERNDWWVSYLDVLVLGLAVVAIFVWIQFDWYARFNDEQGGGAVQSVSAPEVHILQNAQPAMTSDMEDGVTNPVIKESVDRRTYKEWYVTFDELMKNERLSQQMQLNVKDNGLELMFTPGVLFSDDRVSLSRSGKALLAKLLPEIKASNAHLHISGYNDYKERLAKEFESKRVLAEERAIDVLDYFAIKGIADKMMRVLPYRALTEEDRKGERKRISMLLRVSG